MAAEWLSKTIFQKSITGNSSHEYWEAILKYVKNTSFREVPYWYAYHNASLQSSSLNGYSPSSSLHKWDAVSAGFPTGLQCGLYCWTIWGEALDMLCDFGEEDFAVSPLFLLSFFYYPVCCLQELGCFVYDCASLRFLSCFFSQIHTQCLHCGLDTHTVKIVQSFGVSTVISEPHTNNLYQYPITPLQRFRARYV